MKTIRFGLRPLPPFRLDLTAWALRRRPENMIDVWDGERYSRVLAFRGMPVKVEVSGSGDADHPWLHVRAKGQWPGADAEVQKFVKTILERVLGIKRDLRGFYSLAENDRRLKPLAVRFVGVKPPRFPTIFEALVNALACQQLSLTVGIILLNRLAQFCGLPFTEDGTTRFAFPRPEDLSGRRIREIRGLGFSTSKARAMIELSEKIAGKKFDLWIIEEMGDEDAAAQLRGLRGIGRWSSEYVMLRGLGRINLFPGDDVGAQRNLRRLLRLRKDPDYAKIREITRRWRPYSGLVYFHLLLGKLEEGGYL